jgi:hypothetical protein
MLLVILLLLTLLLKFKKILHCDFLETMRYHLALVCLFFSCTQLLPNFNYINLILLISISASIRPYIPNKTTTDFRHASLYLLYGPLDPHWNLRYSNCYIFAENCQSTYLRSICSIRTLKVTKAIKSLLTSSTSATFCNSRRWNSDVLGSENGTL